MVNLSRVDLRRDRMNRKAGDPLAVVETPIRRLGTAVERQQRRMNVDERTKSGDGLRSEDLIEACDDPDIAGLDSLDEGRRVDVIDRQLRQPAHGRLATRTPARGE